MHESRLFALCKFHTQRRNAARRANLNDSCMATPQAFRIAESCENCFVLNHALSCRMLDASTCLFNKLADCAPHVATSRISVGHPGSTASILEAPRSDSATCVAFERRCAKQNRNTFLFCGEHWEGGRQIPAGLAQHLTRRRFHQ